MGSQFVKKLLGATVIGVLCLCTMAVFAAERGSTNGNIQNGGTILEYEGYLYVGSGTKSGGTVRINLETEEVEQVLPYETSYLNAVDGWLYANVNGLNDILDYGLEVIGVYKFRPDGSDLTRLVDTFMSDLQVYGDHIYGFLRYEGQIYTINTDGTGFRKISEFLFGDLNIGDDGLLYARQRYLYCINPVDGSFYPVLDVDFYDDNYSFLVDGDSIYYTHAQNVYKMPRDGSALPVRIGSGSHYMSRAFLNIFDEKIAYRGFDVVSQNSSIFLLDTDTGEEAELETYSRWAFPQPYITGNKVTIISNRITGNLSDENLNIVAFDLLDGTRIEYDTFVYEEPSVDFSSLGDGFIVHKIEADADFVNVKSVNEDGILTECQNGDYMLVGLDGEVKFRRDDIYVRGFSEGLAVARYREDKSLAGFIDISGEFVIQPQFDEVEGFSSGYALVQRDGSYGYIDRSGAYVYIAEDGEWLSSFSHGYAVVKFPNSVRIFNTNFQTIVVADAGNRYANAEIYGITENCLIVSLRYYQEDNYIRKIMIVGQDGEVLLDGSANEMDDFLFSAEPKDDTFYKFMEADASGWNLSIVDGFGNEIKNITEQSRVIIDDNEIEDLKLFRQGGFAVMKKENNIQNITLLDSEFEKLGELTCSHYTVTDRTKYQYDSSNLDDDLKSDYLFLRLDKEYFDHAGPLPIYVIEPVQN